MIRFLTRIWYWLAVDQKLIVWSVVIGFIFTGLGIVPPLMVREMISRMEHPDLSQSFAWLALGIAGLYVLRGVSRYFYGLMSHIAAYRTLHRLMNAVYCQLQRQPPSYLNRRHSGNLVARTVSDVEAVEDFIAHGIPENAAGDSCTNNDERCAVCAELEIGICRPPAASACCCIGVRADHESQQLLEKRTSPVC